MKILAYVFLAFLIVLILGLIELLLTGAIKIVAIVLLGIWVTKLFKRIN